jgi:uncharacterized protein (DUF1800 family)
MPYFAPSPAGWPDEAAKWVSPEALLQRAELAMALARRSRGRIDSIRLLRDTIGPVAAASTRTAIQRAPNRVEAVATVFASPEFQRR